MAIAQEEFRRVLGHFPSGVTVVTTAFEGILYGMTISSFTSLSLDPPLILICVDRQVSSHAAIGGAGFFAVHILGENDERWSRHFATRDVEKFQGIAYEFGLTGAPLLDNMLATMECKVVQQYDGGDHTIFIAEVLAAKTEPGKPLLYFRSGYGQLA